MSNFTLFSVKPESFLLQTLSEIHFSLLTE